MEIGLILFFLSISPVVIFVVGYFLGRASNHEDILPGFSKTIDRDLRRMASKPKLGAVQEPSARDIYLKEHPKEAQEQEAMKQAFDALEVVNRK